EEVPAPGSAATDAEARHADEALAHEERSTAVALASPRAATGLRERAARLEDRGVARHLHAARVAAVARAAEADDARGGADGGEARRDRDRRHAREAIAQEDHRDVVTV